VNRGVVCFAELINLLTINCGQSPEEAGRDLFGLSTFGLLRTWSVKSRLILGTWPE